jgi:mRNA-degrading endonuclease RelE of RelBE toxin-antitoxin system
MPRLRTLRISRALFLMDKKGRLDKAKCICKNICVFEIRFSGGVEEDLKKIKAFDLRKIFDEIEVQLKTGPLDTTKKKKVLESLIPPFEAILPIRELRVGEYRIFYDVDENKKVVFVRAIRRKPPHKTTEEIL